MAELTIRVSEWNERIFNIANFFECDVDEVLKLTDAEIYALSAQVILSLVREAREK